MTVILRPGNRIHTIPGIGVSVSRRAVASAGGVDWSQWLTYAWIFKGAASQAASYIDVVSSQALALGIAPTWDATNGLIFDGAGQYLRTGVTPANGFSAIVRFSTTTPTHGRYPFGYFKSGAVLALMPWRTDSTFYYWSGGVLSKTRQATSGIGAIAGQTGYWNGVADSGTIGAWTATATGDIWLGTMSNNGSPLSDWHYPGNIQFLGLKTTTWTPTEVADLTAAIAAL